MQVLSGWLDPTHTVLWDPVDDLDGVPAAGGVLLEIYSGSSWSLETAMEALARSPWFSRLGEPNGAVIDLAVLADVLPRLQNSSWMRGQRHVSVAFRPYRDGSGHISLRVEIALPAVEPGASDSKNREKQQKFGILDAPSLFDLDLRDSDTLFGPSVLYIDLDHFKKFNNEFTERVVDRTLLPAAHRVLLEVTTGNGRVYAEGGDEFVVLLPNATEAMARAFSDALVARLRAHEFDIDGQNIRLTASCGVAASEHWPRDKIADAANRAKARAKADGRNRVVVLRPDGLVPEI